MLSLKHLLVHYKFGFGTLYQKFFLEVSNRFNEHYSTTDTNDKSRWHKWDRISPNLYLGRIPSIRHGENQPDLIQEEIKKHQEELGLVVSCVLPYEFAQETMAPAKVWFDKKIQQHVLPIKDLTADVSNEAIIETIFKMHDVIKNKKACYVHCKAGRSRSAMIVVIYGAVFDPELQDKTVEEVEATIKNDDLLLEFEDKPQQKRQQVRLEVAQIEKAKEVIQQIKEMLKNKKELNSAETDFQLSGDLSEDFKSLLSSLQLKNEIRKFWSFTEIKTESCRQQSTEILDFFIRIYEANDGSWYKELQQKANGVKQKSVKNAVSKSATQDNSEKSNSYYASLEKFTSYIWTPASSNNTEEKMKNLYNEFLKQIDDYLIKTLNCTKEALEKVKNQRLSSFETPPGNVASPRRSSVCF